MTAVSSSLERASDELAEIQKELYRLERSPLVKLAKSIEAVRETVRRVALEGCSVSVQRVSD